MTRLLSPAQIEQYREEGFVVVEGILDEPTRQAMQDAPSALVERSLSVIHHVRTIHGSAQNTSDSPRGLPLYELAAPDA